METVIGVLLGAIATVLASRYYFKRTINKSLVIYRLLSTSVFQGIASDVRANLNFRFKGRDVTELQQLIFLVANDGERSIRDVIEPLRLELPRHVEVLDASVVHRHPDSVHADVHVDIGANSSPQITLGFPLLNKNEFFVVKVLLSGRLQTRRLAFTILSDDLPRNIELRQLPSAALARDVYKFEWQLALVAAVVLLFPLWICYFGYKLLALRPELSPFPWNHYKPSLESGALLLPAGVVVTLFAFLGIMMMAAAIFGGEFPPPRGPRFPLPNKLRAAVFPYRVVPGEGGIFTETDAQERPKKAGRSRRDKRAQSRN